MSNKQYPLKIPQLKKVSFCGSKSKTGSLVGSSLKIEHKTNNIASVSRYRQPSLTFFDKDNDNHEEQGKEKEVPKKIYTDIQYPNKKVKSKAKLVKESKKDTSCPHSSTCSKGRNQTLRNVNDWLSKSNKSSDRFHTNTTGNLSSSSNGRKKTINKSFQTFASFSNHLSKHLTRRNHPDTSANIKLIYNDNCMTTSNGTKETSTTDKAKNKTLSKYCDEINTPEELHYYYVNILQNGNEIALRFDNENKGKSNIDL